MIGRAVLKPAERRPENRTINRITVLVRERPQSQMGSWSGIQDLVQHSLPPSCLVLWSSFTRGCATKHMYN